MNTARHATPILFLALTLAVGCERQAPPPAAPAGIPGGELMELIDSFLGPNPDSTALVIGGEASELSGFAEYFSETRSGIPFSYFYGDGAFAAAFGAESSLDSPGESDCVLAADADETAATGFTRCVNRQITECAAGTLILMQDEETFAVRFCR